MRRALVTAWVLVAATSGQGLAAADTAGSTRNHGIDSAPAVLAPRERVEPENRMLTDRLEHLLPALMAETGIEMWLVLNREYAEDPVYFTLVPQPAHAARRTTMLVFHLRQDGRVDRLSVNRYPLGPPYQVGWSGGDLAEQWHALSDLIAERDPATIGINVSRHWPVADGLTHGLNRRLLEALPKALHERLVPAEPLVIRWLETRSHQELETWPHVVSLARSVIAEAFSSRVITPGITTTDDVAWYIRQRFASRGLDICGSCPTSTSSDPASSAMPTHHSAESKGASGPAMCCIPTSASAT